MIYPLISNQLKSINLTRDRLNESDPIVLRNGQLVIVKNVLSQSHQGSITPLTRRQVTKAIDAEAQHCIAKILSPEKEPAPLHERIRRVSKQLQALDTLKQNLQTHSRMIQNQNQLSQQYCPDHLIMEMRIESTISALLKCQKLLVKNGYLSELHQLKTDIQGGLVVDWRYMVVNHHTSPTQQLLASLPQETTKEHAAQHRAIVNRAYLNQLAEQISKDKTPFSKRIQDLLTGLGYPENQQVDCFKANKVHWLDWLKKRVDNPKIVDMEPRNLLMGTQNTLFKSIATTLMPTNGAGQQRICASLAAVRDYEQRLEFEKPNIIAEVHRQIDALYNDKWIDLRKMGAEASVTDILSISTGSLFGRHRETHGVGLVNMPQKDFEKILDILKTAMTNRMRIAIELTLSKQKINVFNLKALKTDHQYILKRNKNLRFPFNQVTFGKQFVFGEGLCKAITLRWALAQMKNPARDIRKVEDLILEMATAPGGQKRPYFTNTTGGQITAQDRYIQAACSAQFISRLPSVNESYECNHSYKFLTTSLDLPKFLLKKLGIKTIVLSNIQNYKLDLDNAINDIHYRENDILLENSSGIVLIAFAEEEGHVVGIRTDYQNECYSFFDVNTGYYQFKTESEMLEEFKRYMEIHYPEATGFRSYQHPFTSNTPLSRSQESLAMASSLQWAVEQMKPIEKRFDLLWKTTLQKVLKHEQSIQTNYNSSSTDEPLPKGLLKTMGLEMTHLGFRYVDCIASLGYRDHHVNIEDSSGVIVIRLGTNAKNMGHVLAIQVDYTNKRYGFFDINCGYRGFKSDRDLQEGIGKHLKSNYPMKLAWREECAVYQYKLATHL